MMPDAFRVTSRPLSIDAAFRAVRRRDCGGTCVFVGTVRDRNRGKAVRRLRYTAFAEMAGKEFAAIAAEARRRWEIGAVFIVHRTGVLKPGEPSVVIAISAPHRAGAFEACRFALDRLKEKAPIWKEEFYVHGRAWIAG